jgi:transcriptional regulator with XRE-family HTH domain
VSEQLSRALAEELRRLLADRGISGRELSRLTGIPQKTLAGKLADRTPFDLDDLQAIAGVLEHSASDLVAWAEKH